MAESLGAAVLTLSTDATQLLQGIDLADRKKNDLRKSFEATGKQAKATGADFDLFGKKLSDNAGATDLLSGGLKKLGGALVAGLSVAAVTGAINAYTNFTGQIADMSAKTGIGAEALQRLKYAAEQNGASIEQVTGAIGKLGNNLASGNANAIGALKTLGLSFDEIRAMEPDKAFVAIGDAIAGIEDPMARSKLAMDLFGRAGVELLPMMRGNLSETAEAADRLGIVMSASAVEAGDKLGDSLDSLMLVGQSLIGQVLNPMVPAITAVATWLGENLPKALTFARDGFDWIIKRGMELGVSFQEMILKVVETGNKIPWLGEKLGATSERVASLRQAVQYGKDAIAAFDAQTTTTTQTVAKASSSMKTLNLDYDANKKATDDAAKASKEKAEILEKLRAVAIPLTETQRQLVAQYQAANLSASEMAKIMGVNVVQVERFIAVTRMLGAEIATVHSSVANFAAIFPTEVRAGNDEIERMQIGMGVLREKVTLLRDARLEDVGTAVEEVGIKFSAARIRAEEAMTGISTSVANNLAAALTGAQGFKDAFANIWQGIRNQTMQIFAEILQGFVKNLIGGMVNSMLGNQGNFTSAFKGMTGGIGGVLNGITSLFSGGVGAWVGIAVAGIASIGKLVWSGIKKFGSWISGLFGSHIAKVVNPTRDAWFAGRSVQDIGDQLAPYMDGNQARDMIDRVFKAKTDQELESSTSAIDRILQGGGIPEFAAGGIVMKPTLGMIGEAGPEAVIPLGKALGHSTVIVQLDGRNAARAIVPWIPGEVNILVGA